MIRIMFLIGQPGIGKSTLSMGLETAMQDVCDLCVIQNHHDRDYKAEEAEAKANGFPSMQDPEYKKRYGKEKLEESRKKHGERIVAAYNAHKQSEDKDKDKDKDFVVLIHLPVREKIKQYQWTKDDYEKYIQQAGYEGDIQFLPSIILTPNLKKHTKAETLATLNGRYEHRCGFQEMQTDQQEKDPEKIALQRSLDAALPVERQYEQVQEALEGLENSSTLYLDLNATIETSRGQLVDTLKEILAGSSAVFRRIQDNQGHSA